MPEGVVYVGRPSAYGNPFRAACHMRYDRSTYWCVAAGPEYRPWLPTGNQHPTKAAADAEAVALYRRWIEGENWAAVYARRYTLQRENQGAEMPTPPRLSEVRAALLGLDLCCWCPADQPCHADVLLEIANAPEEATHA